MKLLAVIAAALLSAVGGYVAYYKCAVGPTQQMLAGSDGQMQWLREEYHLRDAQFARIQQLHEAYAPKCNAMCAKISAANEELDRVIGANKTYTPEVTAAMRECLRVQGECREALLEHVYAVSAEMSPGDGARYLAMMKSRLVEPGLNHSAVISPSLK